jgi:hypothetical protein
MTIRLSTWHSPEFNIFTENVDPNESPYAWIKNYANKVIAFYAQLGIRSAIWAYPEAERQKTLTVCKPVQYLLEVNEHRVVAYVDADSWSEYLWGQQDDFEFSTTPRDFASASILIATPVRREEVKAIRRYRIRTPTSFELVEEKTLE